MSHSDCVVEPAHFSAGLQTALSAVQSRITDATRLADRPSGSVKLLAVSKTVAPEAIIAAHRLGVCDFGENYVQEALAKIVALAPLRAELVWHFIGPLQSNKTQIIATHFDWLHSLDRLKIAQRLDQQRPPDLAPLQVCVQVNISHENSKSGLPPEAVIEFVLQVSQLKNLRLRGLMALPAPGAVPDPEPFKLLKELLNKCNHRLAQHHLPLLDTLSMGMSADLETAIKEGATIVRVGSAIFGERK
jgi:pyridoxal phosphate enzyme (YggS family)